jgi:hypothetical protein
VCVCVCFERERKDAACVRERESFLRQAGVPLRAPSHPHPIPSTTITHSLHQSFDAALNCTTKLVVSLAVDAGSALAGTTRLDASLACAGSPTGACPCPCSRSTDPACACVDLAAPITVTLTKTPAYATYPLTYVKSFNAKPTETIIRTGLGFPSLSCDDGAGSASPTCGWATDPVSGGHVPASQGFCCACTLDQAGSDTLGGGSTQSKI